MRKRFSLRCLHYKAVFPSRSARLLLYSSRHGKCNEGRTMSGLLRITIHNDLQVLTLQLEGRVAGSMVQVLQDCWQNTLACHRKLRLRVDLTGVTFIDDAGQACLADMHRQGATLIATDALTKAVVAEITSGNISRGEIHEQSN
jgi:ABC-type transporter Mla MlaB component